MVYGVGKRVISGSILLILGVFARSAHGGTHKHIAFVQPRDIGKSARSLDEGDGSGE
jgi:hypothetical protein